jgi:hypothetical protein
MPPHRFVFKIREPPTIAFVRPEARARFFDDFCGKPKVIDVRVRDDDALNVLECQAEFRQRQA